MTHTQEHIVIKRLRAPLFYDATPAEGLAKYAGKIKVWHALAVCLLVGFIF